MLGIKIQPTAVWSILRPGVATSNLDPFASSVKTLLRFEGVNGTSTPVPTNEGSNTGEVTLSGAPVYTNTEFLNRLTSLDVRSGAKGAAVAYAGNNDHTLLDAVGSVCHELWIKPTSLSASIDPNSNILLSTRPAFNAQGWVIQAQDNGAIQIAGWSAGGSLVLNLVTGAGILTVNEWQHLAFQRSGTRDWSVYRNGILVFSGTAGGAVGSGNNSLDICWSRYSANRFIDGYLDSYRCTHALRYTAPFTPGEFLPLS